jgi:hypothetical protein
MTPGGLARTLLRALGLGGLLRVLIGLLVVLVRELLVAPSFALVVIGALAQLASPVRAGLSLLAMVAGVAALSLPLLLLLGGVGAVGQKSDDQDRDND